MKENIIQTKSFAFAVRSVKAFKFLSEKKREFVLSKQFLRSATSIGSNIEESLGGHSRADFVAKLTIAYKEARETKYWIRLLFATDYLNKKEANSLLSDLEEILRIIAQIRITITKK